MISAGLACVAQAAPTVVTTCGTLSVPGTYNLANSVSTPSTGLCFLITAPNVTFDLNGHSITAGAASSGVTRVGIRVTGTGTGARIHDGSITNLEVAGVNVGIGMRIESASDVRVTGMTITGNSIGMYIIQADNGRFLSNTVSSNSDFGFQVDSGSDNNLFSGNQCNQNGSTGVGGCMFLANNTGNSVLSNTMINNTVHAVIVGAGGTTNQIRNNLISGGQNGVTLSTTTGNTVRSNTITGAGAGIVLFSDASGNIIRSNTVNGSTSFDIVDNGLACDDTYVNNTFTSSTGPAGCIQ
jgi:parallel beta-helix repeat protein